MQGEVIPPFQKQQRATNVARKVLTMTWFSISLMFAVMHLCTTYDVLRDPYPTNSARWWHLGLSQAQSEPGEFAQLKRTTMSIFAALGDHPWINGTTLEVCTLRHVVGFVLTFVYPQPWGSTLCSQQRPCAYGA